MRINSNPMAINAHRQYTVNTGSAAAAKGRVSGAARGHPAGGDATGVAVSENMRAQIRGLKMAARDSADAISLMQMADDALQASQSTLQNMQALAEQSASAANMSSQDRAALNAAFQEQAAKLDDIVGSTRFHGRSVLDGSYTGNTVFTAGSGLPARDAAPFEWVQGEDFALQMRNPDGRVVGELQRADQSASVRIADMRTEALGVNGLSIADQQNAREAAARVKDAADAVSAQRASLGARQEQLTQAMQSLDTSAENLSAAGSRIQDLDMAAEMTNYARKHILSQGDAAVRAQANTIPQGVFSLLGE